MTTTSKKQQLLDLFSKIGLHPTNLVVSSINLIATFPANQVNKAEEMKFTLAQMGLHNARSFHSLDTTPDPNNWRGKNTKVIRVTGEW